LKGRRRKARARKGLISVEEIRHLAWLAKIELTRAEEGALRGDLEKILKYFRKVDEAEVERIPPTFHVIEITNVFRPDVPARGLESEEVLELAPSKKEGYIKAPRMG